MSGSSPEAGEFAAKNRIGIGFAFTTVPMAQKAVRHYRAVANKDGWDPPPDQVIYRAMFHIAESDEQAFADLSTLPPRVALTDQNAAISEAVKDTSYYGTQLLEQSTRNARRDLADRIELGQVIVGSPETALAQVRAHPRRARRRNSRSRRRRAARRQDAALDRAVRHQGAAAHAGALR